MKTTVKLSVAKPPLQKVSRWLISKFAGTRQSSEIILTKSGNAKQMQIKWYVNCKIKCKTTLVVYAQTALVIYPQPSQQNDVVHAHWGARYSSYSSCLSSIYFLLKIECIAPALIAFQNCMSLVCCPNEVKSCIFLQKTLMLTNQTL